MSTPNQKLLARYHKYIERMRAHGASLTIYKCPACGGSIEALQPPRGQIFDSLVQCPHCEELHGKIVRHNGNVETLALLDRRRQKGSSIIGLLASLALLGALVGAAAGIASWFIPAAPVDTRPRLTVTITPTRIDGQLVNCVDTYNHQTGARSRAC